MDERKIASAEKDANTQRVVWGTLILNGILLLVFGYALTSTIQGEMSLISYLAAAAFLLVILIDIASIILVFRQRYELGLKLTYYSLLVLAVVVVSLFQGRALPASILVMIVAMIGITLLFSSGSRRWYSYAVAVALLALWVIEWMNPAWRQSTDMAQAGPIGAVAFGVIFGIFLLSQSWRFISKSLQLKVTFLAGAILAGVSIALIAYSTITAQQIAIKTAEDKALAFTSAQARLIRADTEIPLDTARALAQALTAAKDPENTYRNLSRSQVNSILRQILIENPTFLGIDTLWEPNAFDGQDAFYRGAVGHDLTGRFIPYWVRNDDGSVNLVPLENYETPGIGDWYVIPRQTKTETVIAPLIYPINGVDTVMATFVVPIVYEDKFYGIVGVDAPISFVQNILDNVNLYEGKASAFLMNSDGTLIGVGKTPQMVNKPATEVLPDFADLEAKIKAGEDFISLSPDGQSLRAFAKVDIGRTDDHWVFGLIIPFSEITAPATTEAIRQGGIGATLILLGVILLWFLSGQIVLPLRNLTAVANEVSRGNLNVAAKVQTTDETGLLATAFNLMITQLRETFATLEQRVAERTAKMERRNLDLALATEIGQTVSEVREINDMLKDAAEIIRTFFGLYYVQVYLVNEAQSELTLQFGTGEVGAELMSRRHRLPLNTDSINGRAAITKRSVVIADTSTSNTFRPNPLLPNTRSEVAVPLMVGQKLVGVLNVQSETIGLLTEDALLAFEPMAGQMAVAIQNSKLVAETEQARAEVESLARRLTRAGWEEYLDAIHKPEQSGFVFEQNNITSFIGQKVPAEGAYIAPIEVTGEALGSLVVELHGTSPTSQTDELINTVAKQVSQQIESLRLLESAERFRYEAEQASRRLTHEGWKEYMDAGSTKGISYVYDLNEVHAYEQDKTSQLENNGINLPIKVRDESIGKIVIKDADANDSEAVGIANAVAERLGAHIEGLRLALQTEQALSATKKQAQREQALRQITNAVRSSTDPATILRTAARELGSILGRQTYVQLETTGSDSAAVIEDQPVLPVKLPNADGGVG